MLVESYDQWRKKFLLSSGVEEVDGGIEFKGIFYAYGESVYCLRLGGYSTDLKSQLQGRNAVVTKEGKSIPVLHFYVIPQGRRVEICFNKNIELLKMEEVKAEWFDVKIQHTIDGFVLKHIAYFVTICLVCLLFNDFYAGWGFMICYTFCKIYNHWYGG